MKINWDYIKFFALAILLAFVFWFSQERNQQRHLTALSVDFLDENLNFITLKTVNKLLIQNVSEVKSIGKEALDLNSIEQRLNAHPMIREADVFVTVDGILGANIKQRRPIARVVSKTSFYIDEEGKAMPLSKVRSARVPIITGTSINSKALLPLLLEIKKDEFMMQHVIGLEVTKKGMITMRFRVYDFKIHFGKPKNIKRKFLNLKAFYQKALKDKKLDSYSLVNLQLNTQVIGTKKAK
ncbi:MAG: hypothetical protein JKZ03_04495 [Flavobacteriaceae bacterium]|nr:hypothetical protein [Flavobacteriaceae bacterium]